ncbi:dynein regulatory complex subunit 7 [Caerostris extrusa]|uniref:Dynein regulatory complex subunit 7 n=1 Tax=Caerostris extrusa TaxID=172846 RepID=A0AAV4QBD3_CAEEX|nr:dynein regulatory complex subunit 7 [Caerostris extrusa]
MRKLICTYFCPIKITKTAELREWNECAVFLADYVEYTPLKVPTRSPKILHSLDSILKDEVHYEKFLAKAPYSTASTEKKNKYDLDFEKAKKYWIEGEAAEVVESVEMEAKVPVKKTDILYGKRVHFWVLLRLSKDGLSHPIFLEPSTGEMFQVDSPEYLGIEFVWNDKNFGTITKKLTKVAKD